ncbi:MAG: alpha/beta fold hydrolase [Congregibacter sp.]
MPQVAANDIQIEYESHGDPAAPTVLLIMGLGTQLTAWPDAFCDHLVGHGYHVLRFDNRDVGLSTHFDEARTPNIPALVALKMLRLPSLVPYRLRDMADDAVSLLDALHITAAHVVGVSMGGMLAQLVAAHYPGRTLSMTSIMSTTGNRALPRSDKAATEALVLQPGDPEDMQSIIERNVRVRRALQSPRYPKSDEELWESAAASVARGGYRPQGVARQLAAIIAAKDRRALLKKVQAPSLVIHGEDDGLVKVECGIDTAEHIPNCALKVFPGMAHDLPTPLLAPMADLIHATASRT